MTIGYAAPGRINLIGEHTDYNRGLALPIALPNRTVASFEPDTTEQLVVRSDHAPEPVTIPPRTRPGEVTGWAAYVAGVVWALREAGVAAPGGRLTITSDLPVGAGLASSAALECAVLGALLTAAGRDLDPLRRARLAQRAENGYVGAPTGLMDQLAALTGRAGHALLIDFDALTVHPVRFDPEAHGVALLVIDSHTRHRHADGGYADRRAACERAAADLGVASLRAVPDLAALARVADPDDARRARHVVTENQRVRDVVAALEDADFVAAGRILTEAHVSMRDDFATSTDHIDRIVDAAVDAGALGARMTGGGFGGCVVALVPVGRIAAVDAAVRAAVAHAGGPAPTVTRTHAAAGAGPHPPA
mgnify:CR=1 FL=1